MNYDKNIIILKDFERLIDFYNAKSILQFNGCFEDMGGFLTLFLLEMIQRGRCISRRYVAVALRNEYIRLSKKFFIQCKTEKEFLDFCVSNDFTNLIDEKIIIRDALKTLTENQKKVVKLRFLLGFSCDEIAVKSGITRQAVERTKKRALDKLKALL